MKKILILITVAGVTAAVLTYYRHQQKKAMREFTNQGNDMFDEHQTMFDYAGWVKIT
ncbi:MAG: hypothetical protein ABJA79_06790 [Parafilimonas sp.]